MTQPLKSQTGPLYVDVFKLYMVLLILFFCIFS